MSNPPHLPTPPGRSLRPARFATFHGQHRGAIRMATPNLYAEKLEDAQQKAASWINMHPEIEILTIESCANETLTAVTVWYR